jgi:hypothetical protein
LEQFNREPKGPLNGNATFKPNTKEDDKNKMSIHGIIFMNSLLLCSPTSNFLDMKTMDK